MFFFKILSLILIFTPLTAVQAVSLSSQEIESMSYNKLQKARFAYIEFMVQVEQDMERGVLPDPQKKTSYFKSFWQDLLIAHAFAVTPDGNICFFGGWPSKMSSGKCREPWRTSVDEKVKSLGGYEKASICGSQNLFRCNPALFGSNADGGLCIEIGGTYNNLTEKCEKASRSLVPQIIESYKADPKSLEALSGEIKNFCDGYKSYDSCDDLSRRLKEITGNDIGTYSAEGVQGVSNGPRNGGRSHNVEPVDGDNLGYATPEAPGPGVGAQVLSRCEELLKEKDDVNGRNILGSMDRSDCSEGVKNQMGNFDDVAKIASHINYNQTVLRVNAKAFEQTLMAYMSNEIRFGNGQLPVHDKNALFKKVFGEFDDLLIGDDNKAYTAAFEKAYNTLNEETKKGRLYPIEIESTKDQFNSLATYVNEACSSIRDKFVAKFGDPGWASRTWDSGNKYADFYKEQIPAIHKEVDMLLRESTVGHLVSTPYFKKNVFDPTESFAEECAKNPSYQVIKQPIAASTIAQGHNNVREMLKGNLAKINNNQRLLRTPGEAESKGVLADFLKNDASIVNLTVHDLPNDEQFNLGNLICNETNNILSKDKKWQMADRIIGGVGLGVGVVLMATGVGSPLGVALTAASLGMAGYTGARAVTNYQDSSSRGRGADIALVERREQLEDYLANSEAAASGKRTALIQGGLAALSAFPAVKVLSNAARGGRAAAPAATAAAGRATAAAPPRPALTASPPKPAPAGLPPRAVIPPKPPTALPGAARGAAGAADDVAGAAKNAGTVADDAGAAANKAGSVADDAAASVKGVSLDKVLKGISDEMKVDIPSQMLKGREIKSLSLKEAKELFHKIAKSESGTTFKSAWRKISRAFHPDKYGTKGPEIQKAVEEEFKQAQNILHHIEKLAKEAGEEII